MPELKSGDAFPEGVKFSYIPYTPEIEDVKVCGLPQNYDASQGELFNFFFFFLFSFFYVLWGIAQLASPPAPRMWCGRFSILNRCGIANSLDSFTELANKKAVIVAVPGAFTPTCSSAHLPSYINNLEKLKAKGVDQVIFLAHNDAFVMSGWGKVNGIKDDSIVSNPIPLLSSRALAVICGACVINWR